MPPKKPLPKKPPPKKGKEPAAAAVVSPRGRIQVTHVLRGDAPGMQLHASIGRLRVAVYADFFPVAYKKEGAYAGLDVDLINAFCLRAGIRPQYVRVRDWDGLWDKPGSWTDRIDVAIGGIGRSTWRDSQSVEWTVPYFAVHRTVVYNRKDPIRVFPRDVTGTVAGTMGSTGMNDAISRIQDKFGYDHIQDHIDMRYKSPDAKDIRDLLEGKIQGLMRGSFVGKAIVAKHPDRLGMAKPWVADPRTLQPYGAEVFAFPCRRGSGLAAQLSAFLVRMSYGGELAALVKKHGME